MGNLSSRPSIKKKQAILIGMFSVFKDESGGLSYGTIIQICNLCIRSMTRTFDRSTSPSKPGTKPDPATLDRKRLILVLEKSLTLVLTQGLLFIADHRIQPRDKQLLRRELGAELVRYL